MGIVSSRTSADLKPQRCGTATCGCPAGCEDWGGREEWEQKARQQPTPRYACHSACLHGDTLACPSLRVSSVQVACSTYWSHPGRHLSLKLKYHLRENGRNIKKRWQRWLVKENSLSHHPPRPCAQRTAARERWWSQKSLVGEVEQRPGKDNVKTKEK